jgi:hypothetical protein
VGITQERDALLDFRHHETCVAAELAACVL